MHNIKAEHAAKRKVREMKESSYERSNKMKRENERMRSNGTELKAGTNSDLDVRIETFSAGVNMFYSRWS